MDEKIDPSKFRQELEANLKQILAIAMVIGGSEELEKGIAELSAQLKKFEEEYGKDNQTG